MNIRTLTPVEVENEEEPYPSNMLITPSTTRKKEAQASCRQMNGF